MDNVTGLLDVAVLKTQTIEISSLTAEQKKSAFASLESCVDSNFTPPDPPPFGSAEKNITMGIRDPKRPILYYLKNIYKFFKSS